MKSAVSYSEITKVLASTSALFRRTYEELYPSDLTDQEWALLEPLLASSEGRGRPPKWPAERVADAVFYLLRSGCAWRMLPREYPPWQTVYYHFWW
jgi:transposase